MFFAFRSATLLIDALRSSDRKLFSSAPVSRIIVRMGSRGAFAAAVAFLATIAIGSTVNFMNSLIFEEGAAGRRSVSLSIARDFFSDLYHGGAIALGGACVLLLIVAADAVGLIERFLPGRSPLNPLRRWAKNAFAALRFDHRQPVLFLRSFSDETLHKTVEDLIGKEAFRVGPFIALGLPGEASPSNSAYRAEGRLDATYSDKFTAETYQASMLIAAAWFNPRNSEIAQPAPSR